jgi:hypothetical protein
MRPAPINTPSERMDFETAAFGGMASRMLGTCIFNAGTRNLFARIQPAQQPGIYVKPFPESLEWRLVVQSR